MTEDTKKWSNKEKWEYLKNCHTNYQVLRGQLWALVLAAEGSQPSVEQVKLFGKPIEKPIVNPENIRRNILDILTYLLICSETFNLKYSVVRGTGNPIPPMEELLLWQMLTDNSTYYVNQVTGRSTATLAKLKSMTEQQMMNRIVQRFKKFKKDKENENE